MSPLAARSLDELTVAAEAEWLAGFTAGPTEPEGSGLRGGTAAPDLVLSDHAGASRSLSEFWDGQPALVMFWRHFGCGCGVDRAKRLLAEYPAYAAAGITPVIVAQGEPARAAEYRAQLGLPCPVLCDPDHVAYRAYGLGHWAVERILFDAPVELWSHPHHLGVRFQDDRRAGGRPLVDDPWRATGEFVIGTDGSVRLAHLYQHCEDFPEPLVLIAAAQLAESRALPGT
ncbi:peroxiredoxin-like family protein [Actinospongicola halichondriae]|uniref:peroxiredoxin-like family protein n=1 Tax=Actinospongicola halichondriae TaxID=3236844 RepID=UPI003D4F93E2